MSTIIAWASATLTSPSLLALETERRTKMLNTIRDARKRFLDTQGSVTQRQSEWKAKLDHARHTQKLEGVGLNDAEEKMENMEQLWWNRYDQLTDAMNMKSNKAAI